MVGRGDSGGGGVVVVAWFFKDILGFMRTVKESCKNIFYSVRLTEFLSLNAELLILELFDDHLISN